MTRLITSMLVVLAVSLCLSTGCTPKETVKPAVVKKAVHDHPDKGPHGGPLLEWGAEEYHVEYLFDRDKKQATIYIFDDSAVKASPIAVEEVSLTLTHTKEPIKIALKAEPNKDDPKGKSSRFVAVHDALGDSAAFRGEIGTKIDGKDYHDDFVEKEAKKK